MAKIEALGHVGIHVNDMATQRDFYTRVLGLNVADEDLDGLGMCFLSADPQREHHEFVLVKGKKAPEDVKVIQQISFIVPTIDDLRQYKRRLDDYGAKIDGAEGQELLEDSVPNVGRVVIEELQEVSQLRRVAHADSA